jgi:hypothetical protein
MGKKYVIDEDTLFEIADGIRDLKNIDTVLSPKDFAAELKSVCETFSGMVSRSATHIDLPRGVTRIGAYAFANYTTLTGVTLPNTVTSIENSGFNSCKFKSIAIPKSVNNI